MDAPTLIDHAITQLKQLGLDALVMQEQPQNLPPFKADAWLRIGREAGQRGQEGLVDYVVEVKNRLTPATLGAASMQLQHAAAVTGFAPQLLVEQRMTMARGGQAGDRVLEWRKPFWGEMPATTRPDTVHPVLVYADLLATGDARCIETAQLVYDEYLARLLPAA